jgi:hypothetical protein
MPTTTAQTAIAVVGIDTGKNSFHRGSVFPAPANTGDPNGLLRGLSANEIAGALISMMARSATLQSKAGYIDARPLTTSSSKSSCDARPDHALGNSRPNAHKRKFTLSAIAQERMRFSIHRRKMSSACSVVRARFRGMQKSLRPSRSASATTL